MCQLKQIPHGIPFQSKDAQEIRCECGIDRNSWFPKKQRNKAIAIAKRGLKSRLTDHYHCRIPG